MKRNVKYCGAALAILVPICMPASAPAQTPEQEMVPLELVQTLSFSPLGDHDALPEVLVGRIPEATARMLSLPDDSRIVGSLIYPHYSMSAVAVPGTPAAVRDEWAADLLAAGWTRYERPSRGGFESNPVEGLQFCKDDSVTLSLDVSENPRGGSYVMLVPLTSRTYSICLAEERPSFLRRESLIPSLTPPSGSVTMGGGSGGGSDEWDARTRIHTELTVDELVDHYGSQLRSHGWTPVERTAAQGIAVETYRVTDPEDAAWHAVLTASTPSAESDRFLSLRVTRVERSH